MSNPSNLSKLSIILPTQPVDNQYYNNLSPPLTLDDISSYDESEEGDFDYKKCSIEELHKKLNDLYINLIMEQKKCSREEAIKENKEIKLQLTIDQIIDNAPSCPSREDAKKSLEKHNNNTFDAILEFY